MTTPILVPSAPQGPSRTSYLERTGGRIAYDVVGRGPLVVCLPGMGDVRSACGPLAAHLVESGYRVATVDLRGHGNSDATFATFDDVAAGGDLIALVEARGGPAVLIGNSMGAGAAAWAAAEAPRLVSRLVLIGPSVRNVSLGKVAMLAFRLALLRPWGPAAWRAYCASQFRGRRPAARVNHLGRLRANLHRPGHWRAFMVPGAGHYPQAEFPDVVVPAIAGLLAEVAPIEQRRAS